MVASRAGMRGRGACAVVAASLLALGALGACGGSDVPPPRTSAPLENALEGNVPRPGWMRRQLRLASHQLRRSFATDGADALLRLRLHGDELEMTFTRDTVDRVRRMSSGVAPSPAEQRWFLFESLAQTPLVGYCARGVHVVDARGPEGFRERALVVDRLLIIGGERDGLWGAWVEGLVLTASGWRLLPTTPFARQVETPRRDHTDVQLWDCDVGHQPRRDATLEQ